MVPTVTAFPHTCSRSTGPNTNRPTVRSDAGAGDAVTVNVASPPSVTAGPAAMVTTGSGSPSSFTVTLADEAVASTV